MDHHGVDGATDSVMGTLVVGGGRGGHYREYGGAEEGGDRAAASDGVGSRGDRGVFGSTTTSAGRPFETLPNVADNTQGESERGSGDTEGDNLAQDLISPTLRRYWRCPCCIIRTGMYSETTLELFFLSLTPTMKIATAPDGYRRLPSLKRVR